MSFNIDLPNISAHTESGKIEQIRSYLFQLADQLKWALNSLESGSAKVLQTGSKTEEKSVTEEEAQATFNSIKSLIIRSADIVNVYSEEINKKLEGSYVANSDFGTYLELTEQLINTNSKGITSLFNTVQEIIPEIDNLESSLIDVESHIRAGILYDDGKGVPIYGIEVGQENTIDGKKVFNKYARYTSDRLSFYDKNDTEIAYISDYKLYITNAHITGTLTLGRFEIDTSDGVVIKWV